MTTLVDSNVILDVITEDETWFSWSKEALEKAADAGSIAINPIIYAEISIKFSSVEKLDEILSPDDFIRVPLPWSAGFLAGKCFLDYRKRGGTRTSPLCDFYIGAHAAVSKFQLLTRDVPRYRTYFPTVELHCPDS